MHPGRRQSEVLCQTVSPGHSLLDVPLAASYQRRLTQQFACTATSLAVYICRHVLLFRKRKWILKSKRLIHVETAEHHAAQQSLSANKEIKECRHGLTVQSCAADSLWPHSTTGHNMAACTNTTLRLSYRSRHFCVQYRI